MKASYAELSYRITRVLELHRVHVGRNLEDVEVRSCIECGQDWPCCTVHALGEEL